jgi:hypothetical protein
MKKTFLSILAIVLLSAGFVCGYSVGMMKVEKAKFLASANAWQTAKDKVSEAGILIERTNQISGTVKEFSGKDIVIEAPLINPLQDESLKIRKVRMVDRAEVTILDFKTPAERKEYEKAVQPELDALNKEKQIIVAELESCGVVGGYKGPSLDDPKINNEKCLGLLRSQSALDEKILAINSKIASEYWRSSGSVGDIKPGQMIKVVAGKDVDIASLAEFEAIAAEVGMAPSESEKESGF